MPFLELKLGLSNNPNVPGSRQPSQVCLTNNPRESRSNGSAAKNRTNHYTDTPRAVLRFNDLNIPGTQLVLGL